MKRAFQLAVLILLVVSTVTTCSSLRTRANQIRVQRVRRLDEVE